MDRKTYEQQLELLKKGRLDPRSEAGREALGYARGCHHETHLMLEALIAGVKTLQQKNAAYKLLNKQLIEQLEKSGAGNGGGSVEPYTRRELVIRWMDGSVSRVAADGYEIEAIGDKDYIVPYRLERVDEEPVAMLDGWNSIYWEDTPGSEIRDCIAYKVPEETDTAPGGA